MAFFRWFQLDEPSYPSIWACLGMVVGLYGIGYAYAACRPDRGDVLVAIGLAGKVLGPIGWVLAVGRGELPPRTFVVILANDLIWWFPFLFYLLRDVRQRRRIIAWICASLHLVSCAGLLISRRGTEMQLDMGLRMAWVHEHAAVWIVTWITWSLSSMSLLALLVVWSAALIEMGVNRSITIGCCLLCAIGVAFDLSGEAVNIISLTRFGLTVDEFASGAMLYAVLGAGIANGLYCIAGLILNVVAWRVGHVRGWLGSLGFAVWISGFGLTVATLSESRVAMIITGAAVMVLFIPWVIGLAPRLEPVMRLHLYRRIPG
jgi:hypothetical protein